MKKIKSRVLSIALVFAMLIAGFPTGAIAESMTSGTRAMGAMRPAPAEAPIVAEPSEDSPPQPVVQTPAEDVSVQPAEDAPIAEAPVRPAVSPGLIISPASAPIFAENAESITSSAALLDDKKIENLVPESISYFLTCVPAAGTPLLHGQSMRFTPNIDTSSVGTDDNDDAIIFQDIIVKVTVPGDPETLDFLYPDPNGLTANFGLQVDTYTDRTEFYFTFRNVAAGSGAVGPWFNVGFKNGINPASMSTTISAELYYGDTSLPAVSGGNPIPSCASINVNSTAVPPVYTITDTASSNIAVVDHDNDIVGEDISFNLKVGRKTDHAVAGVIYTDSLSVTHTVKLPEKTSFKDQNLVMISVPGKTTPVTLKVGEKLAVESGGIYKHYEITNVNYSDSTLSYEISYMGESSNGTGTPVLDSGKYSFVSAADFRLTFKEGALATTLTEAELKDNYSINSSSRVDYTYNGGSGFDTSASSIKLYSSALSDTSPPDLTSSLGVKKTFAGAYAANISTGKMNWSAYLSASTSGKEVSSSYPYLQYNLTEFGNKVKLSPGQSNGTMDITISEEVGEFHNHLIPYYVVPGEFSTGSVKYEITYYSTTQGLKTSKNAPTTLPDDTTWFKIVYSDVPAGATIKSGSAYVIFKLADGIPDKETLPNTIYADGTYTYDYTVSGSGTIPITISSPTTGTNRPSSTEQVTYTDKKIPLATSGKSALNIITDRGDYALAGDWVEYTLKLSNIGDATITNVKIKDIMGADYVTNADWPVAVFLVTGDTAATNLQNKPVFTPPTTSSGSPVLNTTAAAQFNHKPTLASNQYTMELDTNNLPSGSNIEIAPGQTMLIKYCVQIKPDAPVGKYISNKFEYTVTEIGGGSGSGSGGTGGIPIEKPAVKPGGEFSFPISPDIVQISTEKYVVPEGTTTKLTTSSMTLDDLKAKGITYTLVAGLDKVVGSTSVHSLKITDVLPSNMKGTVDVPLSIKLIDWTPMGSNGTALATNDYTLTLLSPTVDSNNSVSMTFSKNSGALTPGTYVKIMLEITNIDAETFWGGNLPSITVSSINEIQVRAFDENNEQIISGLTSGNGFLNNKNNQAHVWEQHGLRVTDSTSNTIDISKKVENVSGVIGVTQMPLHGRDIVKYSITIINNGDEIGGSDGKDLVFDYLPQGQAFYNPEGYRLEVTKYAPGNGSGVLVPVFQPGGYSAPSDLIKSTDYNSTSQRERINIRFNIEGGGTRYVITYYAMVIATSDTLMASAEEAAYSNDVYLVAPYNGTTILQKIPATNDIMLLPGDVTALGYDPAKEDIFHAAAGISYTISAIRPGIVKTVSPPDKETDPYYNSFKPINWQLTVHNSSVTEMKNFYVIDLLPAGFTYTLGSTSASLSGVSEPQVFTNANSNGDTVLLWEVTLTDGLMCKADSNSLTAKPVERSLTISFETSPPSDVTSAIFTNYAYVVPIGQEFQLIAYDWYTRNTRGTVSSLEGEIFGGAYAGLQKEGLTLPVHSVTSFKTVAFCADGHISSEKEIAETLDPKNGGGSLTVITIKPQEGSEEVTYTLRVTNPGSSPIDVLGIMDILPHVGDQGTYTSENRGSKFSVTGVSAANVQVIGGSPSGNNVPFTAFYSMAGDGVKNIWDADSGVWKTGSASEYTALLIKFDGGGLSLKPNQEIIVTFTGRVPDDAPRGQIAYNSFATQYRVVDTTLRFEPPKVGVKIYSEYSTLLTVVKTVTGVEDNDSRTFYMRLFIEDADKEWVPHPGSDFEITISGTGTGQHVNIFFKYFQQKNTLCFF